ncbi:MAG TPA: AMP-binding protein [Acidimicrobiia bacterium]|nr:AMP-binding protein [Acidimicrobiia bacterium]
MEFNLADLFECVADRVGERVAVVGEGRRLTYAELDERATRLAHGLAGCGVAAGDHVGLDLYNSPEHVEAMLACFKLRAVPVNVNYRYTAGELAYLARDADLVALVSQPELAGPVAALAADPPERLRTFVEVGDGVAPVVPRALRYEDVLASGGPARDFGARSADDHYVLYTGGTTGMPKGVVWRHEDIFFATLGGGNPGGPPITRPEQIGETVLVNRAQRVGPFLPPGHPGPDEMVVLALGPLMHASGQWSALGTLLGGGRVVLYDRPAMDMAYVLELVERERVVMLTLVGDASARPLLAELDAHPGARDTSSLLLLGSGGSILSGDVKDRLLAAVPTVLAITEAIGSSEAPIQGIALAHQGGPPSASLQFTAKDVTMVLDDRHVPIPPGSGQVGWLATTGHVPLGYYNDPARTARTFVEIDGRRWSLPGDMATIDADGTVHLLGRGSLCVNTGGEKVYPEEVEAVLKSHPDVVDAVVVGVVDARWGQRVAAVVQARDGAAPTLDDVQRHCRAHLAGYKVPRSLRLVPEVRRSPSGKADYPWAARVAEEPLP